MARSLILISLKEGMEVVRVKKKIVALVMLLLSHGACSNGGNTAAQAPSGSTVQVASVQECADGTLPFLGASQFGYNDDVLCLKRDILVKYVDDDHIMRETKGRHRRSAGRLCNPSASEPCSKHGSCQALDGEAYGFCRTL